MTPAEWATIKYFVPYEFESPDLPGSAKNMNFLFMQTLDGIRHSLGQPLQINSGYRSFKHNKAVGGVQSSAHTKGLAADIRCTDSYLRAKLVKAAIKAGISRIGIGPTIVHLDMSTTLPSPRIWLY